MSARFKSRVWTALKTTFTNWNAHDGSLLSAAMAYYAAFSLFPLLLVLIAGIGFLSRFSPQASDTKQELLEVVGRNAGPWVAAQLDTLLAGVETHAGVGGPLGLATLIFAAIGIFAQFENIFQRIWRTPGSESTGLIAAMRSALYERAVAFAMLLVAGLAVIMIFIANLVLAAIRPRVVEMAGGDVAWHLSQTLTTMTFNMLLFGLIYKVLPRVHVRWHEALAGGALVAVVWELGQRIFERFVVTFSYSAYGVIGTFIAIMLWMYYASAIIFLGAEFVRAIGHELRSSVQGTLDMKPPGA